MSKWSVYLIRTRFGALYTGTTTDVARRLAEHRRGGGRGAKYLRAKGPLRLVYGVEIGERTLACKVEHRIKMLTKRQKEEIASRGLSAKALLAFLNLPS